MARACNPSVFNINSSLNSTAINVDSGGNTNGKSFDVTKNF